MNEQHISVAYFRKNGEINILTTFITSEIQKIIRRMDINDKDNLLRLYEAFINLVDAGVVIIIEHEDAYLERTLNIALETSISVYDALYVDQR